MIRPELRDVGQEVFVTGILSAAAYMRVCRGATGLKCAIYLPFSRLHAHLMDFQSVYVCVLHESVRWSEK